MNRINKSVALLALISAATACGNSTGPGARKPDPYLAVRVTDGLDTTAAIGRANWHVFALLSGPEVNQNGVSNQGDIQMTHRRGGHGQLCIKITADSVGQRLLSLIALADTTTEAPTEYATALAIATAWFNGNTTLPAHWMAITEPPADAWLSDQYAAGHGLIPDDPIKWSWNWSGTGTHTFTERTDTDTFCT